LRVHLALCIGVPAVRHACCILSCLLLLRREELWWRARMLLLYCIGSKHDSSIPVTQCTHVLTGVHVFGVREQRCMGAWVVINVTFMAAASKQ
jgi:hypothetical protein